MSITVGSLFSGIGGLDLGLERAGMTVIWQSEINPFASAVLAKHWPQTPNLGDITTIDWTRVERPDLICGGYPCPAFSQAARGRNVAPNMWPWMRRAIEQLRPQYVLIENVAAHLGRGFPDVLADLDALGFDAAWSTLTACSMGAPHMRKRLYCVAYPHGNMQPAFPVYGEVAGVPADAGAVRDGWHPTPVGVGTDDGLPHRLERLRALGNAVVPRLAELVGQMIVEHHEKVAV